VIALLTSAGVRPGPWLNSGLTLAGGRPSVQACKSTLTGIESLVLAFDPPA
jgi:hypothetical protein